MPDEARFTVWWVNLRVKTGEDSGYALRVRQRIISVRPLKKGEGVRLEVVK
jgi:hypothetical protein